MRKKISMSNSKDLTVSEAYEQFIKRYNVKNLSGKTIVYYHDYLAPFLSFVGNDSPIDSITKETVEDYTLSLKQNNALAL